jgi:putative ABC transport system permease protein
MLFVTIKGLIAHKFRLFATALAVTLGVAFMSGTLVLTDTVSRTFDDLFGDVYQQTDAVVRGEEIFDGGVNVGAQRGRIDEAVLATVRSVPGVAEAQGGVFGYARLIGSDGEALGNPATGAPTIGLNWSDSARLNPFQIVDGGPPASDDEVVIDARSAEIGDLAVGDTTTVLVQGPPLEVTISGVARFGSVKTPGGSTVVMFRETVAQALVAEPGMFDDISVVASEGVTQRELVASIREVLPAGAEAVTGEAVTKETQAEVRRSLAFFNTFMLVFAVVALLVGAFMIFNTFSITVAQRTRENGLLRALGAGRRQLMVAVLLEALAVGLIASLLGLVGGLGVAAALQQLLKSLGMLDSLGGVVFAPSTVVISLAAGVGVTLLAAVSPARKAAKVPPIAAMQAGLSGSTGYGSRQRVYVGTGVLLLGLLSLLGGLFGSVDNALLFVGAGALLVFFGVSILGRTVSLPLSRVIGWPLPRVRGVTGEIARGNAMRNPKRTAASASALMIGVGLVGFITIFVSSAKASQNEAIDSSFTGDIVITSGGGLMGGVDPGLAQQVNALPEVAYATGMRQGFASVGDQVEIVTGVNTATAFDVLDIQPIEGQRADLSRFDIAVSKDVADDRGLSVGDTLDVAFKDTGPQQLRLAMIYRQDAVVGPYLLGMPAYDGNFTARYDQQVVVQQSPEVSQAAALAAVERAASAYPGVSVLDREGYKAELAAPFDQMLALIYALLGLAIVIALLGIGNTLALSIFERTREIGLLRAVGMTRSQLRSAIRWESVIIALQGTVLGLGIGVFFGWSMVRALDDEGLTAFQLPVTSMAAIVVLAALAGMLAAVGPSRRAARLDVLKAVVSE